jgi:uncharacterized integral membrane protein
MIRKTVALLVLVPLTAVLIAFAVANRQTVMISLDPFDQAHPALAVALPLFALVLLLVITGVLVGGVAAWLRQGKWRWRARHYEAEARKLRAQVDALKGRPGITEPAAGTLPGDYKPRLTIPPPGG